MSNRHNRYRSRSREPATSGQHVEVFAPLPSIHAQYRQQRQTGSRPQFGVSNAEITSHFQAPAKERCKRHVNEVGQATLLAANLSIPQPRTPRRIVPIRERILKDNRRSVEPQKRGRSAARDDDGTPEKRGRGRPRKDQSIPPSSSRRSTNRDLSRNRTPDIPQVRKARRSVGGYQTTAPLTRAGSRGAENFEPYATRGRSQQPEHGDVRESRRSIGRQPRNQPSKTRKSTDSSVSVVDLETPPPEQPSSSNARRSNVGASESLIVSNAEERILENKAPCIAEMAVSLYDKRLQSNQDATFAPNIFSGEILNNCNGGNHIGLIVDALRQYTDRHR
uniref:Uncharacterized protein n=1 Tax=Panagrolaimus sp. PS1159 TaxID=55785 RepID=A0AC35F2W9_9BILA